MEYLEPTTHYYFFRYEIHINSHVKPGSGVVGSDDNPGNVFREISEGLHEQIVEKTGDKQVLITEFKLIF